MWSFPASPVTGAPASAIAPVSAQALAITVSAGSPGETAFASSS